MFVPAFLTLVSLVSVLASPVIVRDHHPVTLPFARRMNVTGGADVLKMDQARARSLRSKSHASGVKSQAELKKTAVGAAFGVPSTNQGVDYIVEVSFIV